MLPTPFQPKGIQTVVPYISVTGAAELVQFLETVFEGTIVESILNAEKLHHCHMKIGDSTIMIGEIPAPEPASDSDDKDKKKPAGYGGVSLYVYVPDTNAVYKKAIAAGATSLMEPAQQYYGDVNAGVQDTFGNSWWIATHTEDVGGAELQSRSDEHIAKRSKKE